jgi:hypothetical protein
VICRLAGKLLNLKNLWRTIMLKKLTLTALAMLVSSVAVAAGENKLYTDLDLNEDGAISKVEGTALPGLSDKWDALDQNADGMLDPAEFAKLETLDAPATPTAPSK